MEGNAVVDNYRPPQGLNERTVYHHDVNIELALAAPCTDLGLGENCSISEDLCCPGTSCQEVVWGDYYYSDSSDYGWTDIEEGPHCVRDGW